MEHAFKRLLGLLTMTVVLSPADKEQVDDLISAVVLAQNLDTYIDVSLTGLLKLIPSVDVSWNEVNALEQTLRLEIKPEPVKYQHLADKFLDYADQNPIVRHVQATGDTRTHILADFVDMGEFRETSLYRDIFAFIGIETQMVLPLPAPRGVAMGFAVNRDETGFSERDRLVMDTLRPYMVHAYRAAQIREGSELLRSALSATGWSVALVKDDGEVTDLTDGTSEILREVGVEMEPGRPIPQRLESTFAAKVNGYDRTQMAIPSAPVLLSEAPNGAMGSVVPSPEGPHVVLVQSATQIDPHGLAGAGLTPRQIDVAVALAEGGTNQQIARRLGVAEGTVKKHLEAVYRLLEVDNRASAAARVRELSSNYA